MTFPEPQGGTFPEQDSDREWLQRLARGDDGARDWIERKLTCVPRLARWLNGRLGHPLSAADLQDVSQDAVLILWRKLPGFEARASIETWAYRIVRFELLNAVRRAERRRRLGELGCRAVVEAQGEVEPADAVLGRAERSDQLLACLARLGASKRAAIELKHFEQLSFQAIGARLGIPENTVRTRYYRGLAQLRRMLEPSPAATAAPARSLGRVTAPRVWHAALAADGGAPQAGRG